MATRSACVAPPRPSIESGEGKKKTRLVAYGAIRDGRRRLLPGDTEGRVASPPRWLGSSENGPRAGGTGGRPGADAGSRATYGLSPGYGQHGIARRLHHVLRAADR